jgi:hypothetical protein
LKTGALAPTRDHFLQVEDEKTQKNGVDMSILLLSAVILAQWQQPVASNIALDLLHWEMHAVLYRLTATAIKMASKVGAFFLY